MNDVLVRWKINTHIALGNNIRKRSVGDEDMVSATKAREMKAVGFVDILTGVSIPVLGGSNDGGDSSTEEDDESR